MDPQAVSASGVLLVVGVVVAVWRLVRELAA